MRTAVATALAGLGLLAGCGSTDKGLEGPKIEKAKSFELGGFETSGTIEPGRPTTLTFRIDEPSGKPLTRYKTGAGPHTGVHLIIVRADLSQIIHRHPPIAADGTVEQAITFPTAGPWHVLVDAYPDLGESTLQNFQLSKDLEVDGAYQPQSLPPLQAKQTVGGDTFAIALPRTLKSLKPQFFDIRVTDAAGKPARFGTWLGATAHAVFFKKGSLDYFHTHVCRPEAKACTSTTAGSSVVGESEAPGQLTVGTLLPTGGTWKLFLQGKVNGTVVTVPYTLEVS